MQQFTIRDIENLTGIRAHTLRIWEQRYGFFVPKRKGSSHRVYDNEDLKRILRISFLYHNGWKVSKIAALSDEEIRQQVHSITSSSTNDFTYVTLLLEAALDFNEAAFIDQLNAIISERGFEATVVHICYPYLNRLGHLWSTNNVIPAQEHFSSYIIQNRIIVETDRLPHPGGGPELILLCPKGEFHELPLLFINYLLRKQGRGTVYLGTNVGLAELRQVATLPGIEALYIHLITNFTGFEVDDYFESVCKSFPDKRIIASGASVLRMQRSFTNLTALRSEDAIYEFIGTRQPT